MSSTFSEHAEAKMWDLLKDHSHEVGSKYPGDKTGKKNTDCITYVRNVISHAYESMGQSSIASDVWKYTEGMPLAMFLSRLGWKIHYWNPDVRFPRDENPNTRTAISKRKSRPRCITATKVDGLVVNYNLDFKKHPSGGFLSGCTPGPRNNDAIWNKVSRVRFAYGLARGGTHTFLYSFGMVFEVHWDKIDADLYERSSFYSFAWLSGLLLTPAGRSFHVRPDIRKKVVANYFRVRQCRGGSLYLVVR